jgi:multicomponent Na+:H+ antiporter subunit D
MVDHTMISAGLQLPLPLLVVLLGGMLAPFIGLIAEKQKMKLREIWMILVSGSALYSVYVLYQAVKASATQVVLIYSWGQAPPYGGCFEIDMLSVFMAFSITFLGVLISIYASTYMAKETRLTEFYTLFIFMMAGMLGVVMAGDMFTLVSFLKGNWAPIEAGFKYLIMSATAGAFILLSMALIYGLSGTLNFAAIASSVRGAPLTPWLVVVFGTLIIGFGVKSAIVPLHTWLPDAYSEAPGPISSLLAGISTEVGLYALIRLLYLVFDPSVFFMPLAVMAAVGMTIGNIMALRQDDVKRMLAYSSVAQVGYMLIGVCTGLTYGLLGTFLHIFTHSLMKGMAFLGIGSIVEETGSRDIKSLQGISKVMPLTTLSLVVALLGLGGVPGTNGFISKFILFSSAIGAGVPILAIIGVLNAALSMAYYLRVVMTMTSGEVEEGLKIKEAPTLMVGVTLFMALLIIILGIYPGPILGLASEASGSLINGLGNYIGAVLS